VAKAVWATMGDNVKLFSEECRNTGTGCEQNVTFNAKTQLGAAIGPMSALKTGGVIGLSRGSGYVFLMRLKNPANFMEGIEATKLDKVVGDPYMYTDFTGATLYSQNGDMSYDLKANPKFKDHQALTLLVLSWDALEGAPSKWEDMKLEARCYNDGQHPPAFAEVVDVKDAGQRTFVTVGSCRSKDVNKVELKVTQLNDKDTITRVKAFNVFFFQGE
jgi:hypothetical protein